MIQFLCPIAEQMLYDFCLLVEELYGEKAYNYTAQSIFGSGDLYGPIQCLTLKVKMNTFNGKNFISNLFLAVMNLLISETYSENLCLP